MEEASKIEPQTAKVANLRKQYHTPKLQHFGFLHELTKGIGYSEDDVFRPYDNGGGGCGCVSCGCAIGCV